MRRRGIIVVIIAVAAAVFFGVYSLAYRAGESSGRSKVTADRSAFQTQVASAPKAAAGGGGQPGGGGTAGGGGTRGSAGGSAVAGGGTGQGRGGTNATTPAGSAVAGRATSTVAGKVTAVSGTTLNVQQADNTMVSVTTNADTAVRKLVTGALPDLKAGDIVAVDGSKTSDTALSAKTVTSLGAASGTGVPSGGGGRAGGGGPSGAQTGGAAPALTGQIKSVAGGTIMVQGFDGSSVTVTTTPATVVRTQQPGAVSDIKAGDMLLVQGDKVGSTEFLARTITNQGPTSG
jgi:hypothetical protein